LGEDEGSFAVLIFSPVSKPNVSNESKRSPRPTTRHSDRPTNNKNAPKRNKENAMNDLRANLPTPPKLLDPHLQQRLPRKPAAGIENRGSTPRASKLLFDLGESVLDALFAGDVGADANGFAAGAVDLFDQRFVVLWRAGE
jgi:hypothetical protein